MSVEPSLRRPPEHGPDPEPDSFDLLLESYRAFLLAIANQEIEGRLLPKGGASDLVQETLLAAHQNREQFQGHSPDDLAGWLRGILRHRIEHLRRRFQTARRCLGREAPPDALALLGVADSLPPEQLERDEELEALAKALGRLPDRLRAVIALRIQGGHSFRDVGEQIGRSEDAARMLFRRALDRLRELLRPRRTD